MDDFTLVIPAHNEEFRIKKTLESFKKAFGNKTKIFVVSNGSSDNTAKILEEWKKKNKNFDFLDFPDKLGKGGAVLEGLKRVKTKKMGFMDADDAFDLDHVKKLIRLVDKYDCVIGSKWKGKNFFQVTEPGFRKLMSRGWNLLVRLLVNLNYKDTQAGAKFFTKKAFDKISKEPFICKNFSFDVELLYKFKRNGFSIREVFIPSKHREGSSFSYKEVFPMFKNLLEVCRYRFSGK